MHVHLGGINATGARAAANRIVRGGDTTGSTTRELGIPTGTSSWLTLGQRRLQADRRKSRCRNCFNTRRRRLLPLVTGWTSMATMDHIASLVGGILHRSIPLVHRPGVASIRVSGSFTMRVGISWMAAWWRRRTQPRNLRVQSFRSQYTSGTQSNGTFTCGSTRTACRRSPLRIPALPVADCGWPTGFPDQMKAVITRDLRIEGGALIRNAEFLRA